LEEELNQAKEQIQALQGQLSTSSFTGPEDSELTKLRFDKQALENKFRKFAVHCQHLEDEKENILRVLGLTKSSDDISSAIVTLCDKLASLEKECDSLAKSENRASSSLVVVDQLREKNAELQRQVSDYQKKIDTLVRDQVEYKELVASLRREQQELRGLADRARGSAENIENKKTADVRFLEQENLQLMTDLNATKKQLKNVRSELTMLRAQASVSVADIGMLPPPPPLSKPVGSESVKKSSSSRSRSNPSGGKRPKTPGTEKENSNNVLENPDSSKATQGTTSSSRRTQRAAVGLGEAFAATDENTQDCQQQ